MRKMTNEEMMNVEGGKLSACASSSLMFAGSAAVAYLSGGIFSFWVGVEFAVMVMSCAGSSV